MNELLNLYSLLDQAGIFKEIYDTYSTVFLEAALAFALLNCFSDINSERCGAASLVFFWELAPD